MDKEELKQKLKEKDELILQLEEGISDEIDNLREELKEIKDKNKLLEKRGDDFQKVFEDDKLIFKKQLKEIEELKFKLFAKQKETAEVEK